MKWHKPIGILLVGCALPMSPSGARADDLEVSSVIDAVTVYASGAEVQRGAGVRIPAGEHRLVLGGLPPGIDPARLQLRVDGQGVRLGTLQLEEVHAGDLAGDTERELQGQLDELLFERQEIVDEIATADTQLQLLASLADGSVGGAQAQPDADALAGLLQSLAGASRDARRTVREANRDLAAKDREIEQKRFELEQVRTNQRSRQVVTAAVAVDLEVDAELTLSYPVAAAGWSWLYEARLDTDARTIELQRKVSVTQASGEDWNGVQLTVTTARPNENTLTPRLGSLLVDFLDAQPMRLERSVASDAVLVQSAQEPPAQGVGPRSFAATEATRYLVNFVIPGAVDVAADSQPRILPIDQRVAPVELVSRAVPERDSSAYLEARFTLESEQPLQAGIVQLYRDGAFIGRRHEESLQAGEALSLAFGRDERIRVETLPEQEQSRDGGTLRRNNVDDRRVRYRVTSFHGAPVTLEILGRIPVARNQAIEVEVDDQATPFDQEDVDGNRGVVLWKREARPNVPVEIRHYYRISYPRDNRLWFQDY